VLWVALTLSPALHFSKTFYGAISMHVSEIDHIVSGMKISL
jgi:hypothetical protein